MIAKSQWEALGFVESWLSELREFIKESWLKQMDIDQKLLKHLMNAGYNYLDSIRFVYCWGKTAIKL